MAYVLAQVVGRPLSASAWLLAALAWLLAWLSVALLSPSLLALELETGALYWLAVAPLLVDGSVGAWVAHPSAARLVLLSALLLALPQ